MEPTLAGEKLNVDVVLVFKLNESIRNLTGREQEYINMVEVVELVNTPGCGPGAR